MSQDRHCPLTEKRPNFFKDGVIMDDIIISTHDINNFIFDQLIKSGHAPEPGDLEILTNITFEYLIHIGIINEEDVEPY